MSAPTGKGATASMEEKRALLARLLKEKNAARPAWSGLRGLFEAQVAKTPDGVAVVGEKDGRVLLYRELNEAANRLAHRLIALGVGPEKLVGVSLERTPEMLVALLGIIKAGGAYVPLDPAFPEARLAIMVEDARLPVIITQKSLVESIPIGDAQVVLIDSDWDQTEPAATNPPDRLTSENLAYVLFTSGSTGRPKGVQVSHAALANFLRSMAELLEVSASDVLLAVTTLSFDIAGLELFLPLTLGARVELASRELASDGARLAARLDRGDVTVLQATPATWRMLLDAGWNGSPRLKMLCGGEALARPLADRLRDKGEVLWNLYGPTETTIWSSMWKVSHDEAPIAIGTPIANTKLLVLDARMRPVPVGITGELFIGGLGVARGYLDRPGLTAERFLPNPLGGAPGARVYRTGDLARWRSDGLLECLGRADHQVKIRGFRVELGEIEAALARHPMVRETVVVAREDAAGENSLVAYWSSRPGTTPETAELRQALTESLPDYMIPAVFMRLDALPLTPNGKIDRNALPDPEPDQSESGERYIPPRGPIEEALVGIWGDLLARPKVGVRDNFFDLGGHSLFATQLIARLRDMFGVEPSLREFLDDPTVAGLSKLIERQIAAGAGVQSPPIVPVRREGPLPASFAQQRLWFLDQLEPGSPSYNIPVAVRMTGPLDVSALRMALNEIVRRHESLRTTFTSEGGIPYQVIAPELELALPEIDATRAGISPQDEARRLIGLEARQPFDLATGPLIRGVLIRLGDDEHVVAVTMHHIISDGWSIGVLIGEVSVLYEAFRLGTSSPLPPLTIQYADYSAWQRGWLQGEALTTQLDYWKDRLGGVPSLELPGDRPRPAVPSGLGGERSIPLAKETLAGIRAIAREEGATFYMALLAAFEVLLHRYTNQEDFAVGTPIAGRTRSEIEGLIGLFVNTLVLRSDLSGDPSFRTLLQRVRREALGAYAHQDLPFDQLIGVLHPDRDLSRTPLFQAMFVLQNAPLEIPKSADLEIEVLDPISGTAKFDVTLYVTELDSEFKATMEYRSDLFEAATVDRMLGHFKTLLAEIAAAPDRAVGSLTMMTEEETRSLLGGGDDLEGDFSDLDEAELDALLNDLTPGEDSADA